MKSSMRSEKEIQDAITGLRKFLQAGMLVDILVGQEEPDIGDLEIVVTVTALEWALGVECDVPGKGSFSDLLKRTAAAGEKAEAYLKAQGVL